MNRLVEKIEALKQLLKDEVCCNKCNDTTIEEVLYIIKAEFAEKNAPKARDGIYTLRTARFLLV